MSISQDEYRTRRQQLAERIGKDAVAVFQGANGPTGTSAFRQYNDLYYLCGIDVPGMYALLRGGSGEMTVFLPREDQLDRQEEGLLICADNPDFVIAQTGVDAVKGLHGLADLLGRASLVYTPFEEGQLRGVNRHDSESWLRALNADPWDERLDRAAQFVHTLRRRYPQLEVRNLSEIMDDLRLVKSEAEIAIMRRAGSLCAGAVCDAMRATAPGLLEYQLDAVMRYHYLAGGATGNGYHAIVASGENMLYPHYHRNDAVLEDGGWLLADCAPEVDYYTSDIGRMWPVNGRYSDAQRALYGFVVAYHQAFLDAIRPGRMMREIHDEVTEAMRPVYEDWTFASERDREAAAAMLEFPYHLSHSVGMSCHDGFGHFHRPLEPGMVFSVDPTLQHKDLRYYIRVEDTVLVTAEGIENLTAAAPLDLDAVEALMQEPGMLQAFPPN